MDYDNTSSSASASLSSQRLLLLIEALSLLAVSAVGIHYFGWADGARFAAATIVTYIIPRITLTRARGFSRAAVVVLLLVALLIAILCITRMVRWTQADGYDLEVPNILVHDARKYYQWALWYYDGRVEQPPYIAFTGFSLLITKLWQIFGVNVIWPQALNTLCTLMGVTLTGMTTRRLLHGRVHVSERVLLAGGMALCATILYYICMGTHILKEGCILFSMASIGYVLSGLDARGRDWLTWRDVLLMPLAVLLLALVRNTFLYFVALGIIIMAIRQWRHTWLPATLMLIVTAVAFHIGNQFASYSVGHHLEIIDGGWDMQHFYMDTSAQSAYVSVIGRYFLHPWWKRLLLLPITTGIQFITPLPWVAYDVYYFPYVLPRVTFGWYAIGGIALFYYLFISWRRGQGIGLWPWWIALSYLIIAYVIGGSVSRYALSFEAMLVPVAIYVLCQLHAGHWRKPFTYWTITYIILLTATLLTCLEMQTGTLTRLLHQLTPT